MLVSVGLYASEEVVLKATRVAHVLVLKQVYLNGQGPFRMMVDTGAASCLIRPAVAKRLGLQPAYAVEHETVNGVNLVPAAMLEDLRIGTIRDQGVEIILTDLRLPGVDGVLGQSWLIRHDYLLNYHDRQVEIEAPEPRHGIRAALRSTDGRPMITAKVDGRRQDLVVDSGAPVLVLFERSQLARSALLVTNNGSADVAMRGARVEIGATFARRMEAVEVNGPPATGLLPAGVFASVYISNRNGVVVLVP